MTPSEDSAKTEDEKKDETEVKQEEKKEEKKEETAKADTSNKSNSSESKKNNTASTNSSSNKNNSSSNSSKPSSKPSNNNSSNSSKPAEHTHDWVAQYKTVNVPEQGHNEQVLVQAAYDEQVPITEMRAHDICNQCGADLTGTDIPAHMENSYLNGGNCGGHHTEWRETVVGYKTVHHDAVYETRYVVDSPATTKQELTGYKCSGCGKTKAN